MKRSGIILSIIACFFTISILLISCENNKKELLFACDSTNVKYSTTIKPIIENNCYNCHSTASASNFGSGIVLDNHTDVKAWVDITSGSDGGQLLQDVKSGRMPKGRSKLSDCEIAKISQWIKGGALNN
jgi:uncharacterized membrane protein